LYKTSPKGYRFLSTLFALPSRKTLSGLLNKVPFHPGINLHHIIENLKCQVKNLKEIDKTCVLLFDEMALDPGLTYDKKIKTYLRLRIMMNIQPQHNFPIMFLSLY